MKKFNKGIVLAIAAVLLLTLTLGFLPNAVSQKDETSETNNLSYQEQLPEVDEEVAILETNMGVIKLRLFPTEAPLAVSNFIKLAQEDFYDEVKFHRIIKGFMIQTGDPLSKDDDPENDGQGGPGYEFEDEFSEKLSNIPYSLAMANSGPNTNGSQFFINEVENTYLDNVHTVFGQVYSGQEVVNKIANLATNENNQALSDVFIQDITITKYGSELEQSFEVENTTESSWIKSTFKILLWILLGLVAVLVGLLIFAKLKLGKSRPAPTLPKKKRKKKNKNYGKIKKRKR